MIFLACAFLALGNLGARPAAADISQDVATFMEQLRNREPIDPYQLEIVPPQQLLPELKKYLGDSSKPVRFYSLQLMLSIEHKSRDLATRQEAVELALTGVETEPLPEVAGNIARRMLSLPPSTFSQKSKDIIARMMSRDVVSSDVVRLAGLANVKTPAVKQRLQKMFTLALEINKSKLDEKGKPVPPTLEEQFDIDKTRAVVWAMAAMGDAKAIQILIADLDNAPDAVARLGPLQYLAYTRQPQAIAAVARYLFLEERLPNTMVDTSPGPKLAYRVINLLSEIIGDWPSETAFNGTDEALIQARQWVKKQGISNLKIKR